MDQPALFYESINDALDATVKACGGAKVVASKMWPDKTPDAAHRLLLACLNEDRVEKLGPDQVMFLLRLGRERGFHGAIQFISGDAGYDSPRPIDSEKQAKRLVDVIQQCTQAQTAALKQLQTLAELNPALLRAVS
ncbi:hypothetical protein [Paraburkholderia saeva]|uniref:hypothetical protein n=1 Tax=Paraburkholderia saeva TaxID=2777537 RepID=UPI001DBE48BB|nr:hypothetical protein [Paraburkholderia saeva]CAG4887859.1 hypothetical protein R52603_00526 [Paraburkholderia saeva]